MYDVPLLFERGLDEYFDLILCVYCPREMQKKRLLMRDQITPSLAEEILAKQMDVEKKRALSNVVITNTGDLEALEQECQDAFKKIFS